MLFCVAFPLSAMVKFGLVLSSILLLYYSSVAQTTQFGAGYVCLVPIDKMFSPSQGIGAGMRVLFKEKESALEFRLGLVNSRSGELGQLDFRNELRVGLSVGFTWIATVGTAFQFDYGIEAGSFRRTITTTAPLYYTTTDKVVEHQNITLGPRLGLHYCAHKWVHPYVMIQPQIEIPLIQSTSNHSSQDDTMVQLNGIVVIGFWFAVTRSFQ